MTDEEIEALAMAECGACRAVIPLDSSECPECGTNFSGVSEDELGECGGCNALVPLDSSRCPECGVLFVADDVVDILRKWIANTGIQIRKLFEKFDENGDGTIDSSELKNGLLSLNLADLPPSQVERLVSEIDADGNGVIDLDEFDQILNGDASDEQGSDPVDAARESTASIEEEAEEAVEDASDETEESAEENHDDASDDEEEVQDDAVAEHDETNELGEEYEDEGAHSIDDEDFDLEDESDEIEEDELEDEPDEDEAEDDSSDDKPEGHRPLAALSALADLMDEHDISAQRLFNDLDADGNGLISIDELKSMVEERYGDVLEIDQVNAIMEGIDGDGDGMIDIAEFIGSMEDYDAMEELVEEKIFPSPMQKRMMSKAWNDTVWPIVHVAFGILLVIFIANGMVGFVDGSGGNVAYVANDSPIIPGDNLTEGDIYPCDEKYQKDGCRNSLTPLAGEKGSLSMPTGFYWDGILFILLSTVGLGASLFLHLLKAPEWRARAKAMKEFVDDKSEANEKASEETGVDESDHGDEEEPHDDETVDDEEHDEEHDEDEAEDDEGHDDDVDDEDDNIDIGSRIGLVFDEEEVFGTIIEFDDDEETVTIEEEGTGDLITGYQEDMFIE